MRIWIKFIHSCRLHFDVCLIDSLGLWNHKIFYFLEESHSVLYFISSQIEVAFLLHAVKKDIPAGADILYFVYINGLRLCVDPVNDLVIDTRLLGAPSVLSTVEEF